MEYTVAKLANVSSRALRYYDTIGLLVPNRAGGCEYRLYGTAQVDRLLQILFYKDLGMSLADIKNALDNPEFDEGAALNSHLVKLTLQKERTLSLIATVEKPIMHRKAGTVMNDKEKFEGFKCSLISESEEKYGSEIREKYGDDEVDASNAKLMNLSKEDYDELQAKSDLIISLLEKAVSDGADPAGSVGFDLYELHRDWLSYTWKSYSPEAHKGLAAMYTDDERFKAYYDKNVPNCAEFLRLAIENFVK